MPTPPPALSTRLGDAPSSTVRDILELTRRAEVISFAGGLPAPEPFPAELIADAFARALAPPAAARALQCSSTEGDPGLRALLAARFTGRGLDCDEHDVAFVPGFPFFAQQPDSRTLRLAFTTHVPAEIAEGLARLGRAAGTAA